MKKYNLFLDDVRNPIDVWRYTHKQVYMRDDWVIARSYNDFVRVVTERFKNGEIPELISYDHDLADVHYREASFKDGKVYMKYSESTSEKTGWHCAKWIIDFYMDNKIKASNFLVHSMNPTGGENIHSLLSQYNKVDEN